MRRDRGVWHRHLLALLGIGLLSTLLPEVAAACPMCKEALTDPAQLPQRLGMAKGYAMSIGLLLAVPAGLLGTVAALLVSAHRRAARRPREVPGD